MDYIINALYFSIFLFIYILIVKIFMWVANYVGEQLGFGKFLIYLWQKIRKKWIFHIDKKKS